MFFDQSGETQFPSHTCRTQHDIGRRVPCADGGLWLATPVDVLLVLLPLLEEGREQARRDEAC